MTTRLEKIKEIFEKHGITLFESDLPNIGSAMQETIEMIADELEEKEPYATVTISRYREVASDIYSEVNQEDEDN